MGFGGNYAPRGLSPQMYDMPVIQNNEGVSKSAPSFFYAQGPDFHKPRLCYYLKILYL